MVHEETNGIAVFSTSEAVKKLFGGADCEAGGFFAMKWTKPHKVSTAFFQLNEELEELLFRCVLYPLRAKRVGR